MEFYCTQCGLTVSASTLENTCACGGLFSLPQDSLPLWKETLIDKSVWGQFRYHQFMNLEDDSWREVSMGEGMTPIVKLDHDILVKMDYMMPTLSFKDRGAAVLVSHMKSIGVKKCVQDSSGNAGVAVAAYCARSGIACEIYVPEGTSPGKIAMIEGFGAKAVIVEGSRDHCADVCRSKVKEEGAYYANHVYNPFFYEGTKAYIYETFEQLGRIPQNIFIELGNGTLFIGALLALEHLLRSNVIPRMPQIIAVQSENCAPFYETLENNLSHLAEVQPKPTLAEGIAIGKPARAAEVLDMIHRHSIRVITAPEDQILPCREQLARKGFYVEHTTAAALAAYHRYCEVYGHTSDALLSLCGAGLKSEH